jgi:mRNA interferase MazF
MVISQYDVFLITLDPAIGAEIKKSRPCVIISPDEMNHHLATVMVVPLTTKFHAFPTRVPLTFARKQGWVVVDQIRTVDKRRLRKRLGRIESKTIAAIKSIIEDMLVD